MTVSDFFFRKNNGVRIDNVPICPQSSFSNFIHSIKQSIMKKCISLIHYSLIIIGVIFITSCQKEDAITYNEYEKLRIKLESDQNFTDYMQAQEELYRFTVENKVDWNGINNYITESGESNICNWETDFLNDLEGGILYQQLLCAGIYSNMNQLFHRYASILVNLEAAQLNDLFGFSPENAAPRASCLDALNVQLAAIPSSCVDNFDDWEGIYGSAVDCMYNETELAYIGYDYCICSNYDYC